MPACQGITCLLACRDEERDHSLATQTGEECQQDHVIVWGLKHYKGCVKELLVIW